MKQQLFYIAGLLVTMFFAYRFMSKVKDVPKEHERKEPVKPTGEIPNDKIILVENVNREQIQSVLEKFCKMYNEDEYAILPRLILLSESKFAITFPFNDTLEIVCYLVNYLSYSAKIEWNPVVYGWATVENESSWEDDKDILGKKIMLYCSSEKGDDSEFTEIITSENQAYRINLSSEIVKKEHPEKQYITPELQPDDLQEKEFFDFE